MAIMQLKAGNSSTAKIQDSNQENFFLLLRRRTPAQMPVAVIDRVWWQTKAYVIILGIMLLVFTSLLFVYLHWFCQKCLPIPTKRAMKNIG